MIHFRGERLSLTSYNQHEYPFSRPYTRTAKLSVYICQQSPLPPHSCNIIIPIRSCLQGHCSTVSSSAGAQQSPVPPHSSNIIITIRICVQDIAAQLAQVQVYSSHPSHHTAATTSYQSVAVCRTFQHS